MSVIVFAGASQFVGVRLIVEDVPAAVIVLAVMLVNLRHVLYSAVARAVRGAARPAVALAARLPADRRGVRDRHRALPPRRRIAVRPLVLLRRGVALWATWQRNTAPRRLPRRRGTRQWSLDFALPLTFIAILVAGAAGAVRRWARPPSPGSSPSWRSAGRTASASRRAAAGMAAGIALDAPSATARLRADELEAMP